jgi:nitrogen fixation/metabolism regulation signal transduction histidine kinase
MRPLGRVMNLDFFASGSWRRKAIPVAIGIIAVFALLLLVLLSLASSNTLFFENYFIWLYAANVVMGICLTLVILILASVIALRWYRGHFGTRLVAKLAMIFALVGVVPGLILYGVSLQFVSRSIETWFDVKVESALEAGLELGRATLSNSLSELQDEGRIVIDQIRTIPNYSSPAELTLLISRMRDQFGIQEISIFDSHQTVVATAASGALLKQSPSPSPEVMVQASKVGHVSIIDEPLSTAGSQEYLLRVILPLVKEGSASTRGFGLNTQYQKELWYLQLVKVVPEDISKNPSRNLLLALIARSIYT